MTAEIAVLNKSAVALAADSAVTISAGSIEEKIFNTADKLFELSDKNPIGIMIYNGMSFMEAPLPLLIKQFRNECKEVERTQDAATEFLKYLDDFGKNCSVELKERHIERLIGPTIKKIRNDVSASVQKLIFDENITPEDFQKQSEKALNDILVDLENAAGNAQQASFFDAGDFDLNEKLKAKIVSMVDDYLDGLEKSAKDRIIAILNKTLMGDILSPGLTGIVIAGFGTKDMFPTLISFEIDGMVCNHLKHVRTNFVDIDRNTDPAHSKDRAKVLPFAQREMVDRFLYGLDEEGQSDIENFARTTISIIRQKLSEKYVFENEEGADTFAVDIKGLEDVFVDGLINKAFKGIKDRSRREIEDMVEFMPKPDLAHMAEALVELTSIKRKVSRGMETVGGPIDVAIISRSEGFVWIKRKHYFPREINKRYYSKLVRTIQGHKENGNGA